MLKVAVIGRPNVGKSTLFNKLTQTRHAIVRDEPGVTRDVQRGVVHWDGYEFEIYDTAGITDDESKAWSTEIRKKAIRASESADLILLILDGKTGLNPEDEDLVRMIKALRKPFLTVVNKVDNPENADLQLADFYQLGCDPMYAASFEHKRGLDEILDWIIQGVDKEVADRQDDRIRLAIIGKPNAGKSTLANTLLGKDEFVVSPVAGTTIDSVNRPFEWEGEKFLLIDTAGVRRHARRSHEVEHLSALKARETIKQADLLVLVIDGLIGPSQQDARIIELAQEQHKAVIIAMNKEDVASAKIPKFRDTTLDRVAQEFHFYADIPVVFISAKTKRGLGDLFKCIKDVWEKLNRRISTKDINEFFVRVIRQAPSPIYQGNDVKFYYITQTRQRPPSFMAYVNAPQGITSSYRRFLVNRIKDEFSLKGVPIRIYPKKRGSHGQEENA